MATRSTNTFAEALQRLLGDIAQMKILPDSDLPFTMELETMVVGKLRELNGITGMQDQNQLPAGGPGMPPEMGGLPPGMGPPPGPIGPPQPGGLQTMPAAPNADALQRLLTAGQ